jgi:hypothetical protein
MKQDVDPEAKLRRYLLGELTHEEQVSLEQRLFLDTDYAEVVQSVEDDLIDDYVQGVLTGVERENFITHFLKRPEHREDVRIAEALERSFAADRKVNPVIPFPTPSHRKTTLWIALAATVLIIFSVIAWNIYRSGRQPNDELLQAGGTQPSPTESASPQASPSPEPQKKPSPERERQPPQRQSATSVFAVTIFPGGGTRGSAQTKEVTIPAATKNVLLTMPVVTVRNYSRYHLELLDAGRVLVVRKLNVGSNPELGRIVSLEFPAKLLEQKNYEIRLRGINTDGSPGELTTYAFSVKKHQ